MPTTISETLQPDSEAGKLQADLHEVFGKILSHTRGIKSTVVLGDNVEALGRISELEAYLERGLEVLSRPITA